jgi:hypothetical protein
MQKETHIIIATEGYLNDKVKCEKIELTDQDEAFLDEDNGFEDFGGYVDYMLEESRNEYEQGFSTVLILSESQIEPLIQNLIKLQG